MSSGTNSIQTSKVSDNFFEDNTIEFLFHRIEAYIKKRGAGDMFPAQQIPNPDNKAARGAYLGL